MSRPSPAADVDSRVGAMKAPDLFLIDAEVKPLASA
jgi:hypothetical protein